MVLDFSSLEVVFFPTSIFFCFNIHSFRFVQIFISSWLSPGRLLFLEIYPFLLSYPIYWHILVHISLIILFISVTSVVLLPLSLPFLVIWLFSIFFVSLAKIFSVLLIFLDLYKKQLLISVVFLLFFYSLFNLSLL